MSNNHGSTLKKGYDGQRIFNAREDGYSFDVFSHTWELGYKNYLYLDWMNELDIDIETYLDLRLAVAHAAKNYPYSSLNKYVSILKTIAAYLNVYDFRAWWLALDSYKKSVRDSLFALCASRNSYTSTILYPLYDSIKDDRIGRQDMIKGILDPITGAYSEVEHDNILESLRIETLQVFEEKRRTQRTFTASRNIIASHLLTALIRRPTQLVQIKWCDILPVGQIFESHNHPNLNWQPVTQHLFSDMDQLHVRIFKGKDGQFRGNAESRSKRLEPDFSQLLLRYYQIYESYLLHSLSAQHVSLNNDETKELMRRLPVLPDLSLFSSNFKSKTELFNSVSDTSKAYHMQSDNLRKNINYLFENKLKPKSDRRPDDSLSLKNNRWRHTILTLGAKHGLPPSHLAAITNVSIVAIYPYLDLKAAERVKIDEAYAGNQIIQRFDSVSVEELQMHDDFKVKSMFDEEIGYKLTPANCSSCQSKGGAPMACYPCDNFRPLETANHQQYLDKAERKLAINSHSAHPATVQRLKKIILYIKMTIILCEERKTAKVGGEK
ncbi:hypothetical protein [Vibrio parahaemolyticus]|uniref:hypothetical protein n=1 Tax=Vibrio parahaemolyticus TaxID=670 RepID=UPI0022EAB34A|nr:hypothetical protein [Vibrio parahaemolyticus]